MKPTLSRELADWRDQVKRRDLRVCDWLGMDPARLIKISDADPNEWGEVEVTWESTDREQPTHGKVIETGARGGWDQKTIHSGKLVLHPEDANALLAAAGPRPEFPVPAEVPSGAPGAAR